MKNFFALLLAPVLLLVTAQASAGPSGYHLAKTYTLGGDAGWDYITVDAAARRVYITHFRSVDVLDADSGKLVGQVKDMNGARGVALVPALGRGYATNGKTDSVIVFDTQTLARLGEIKVGKKPDSTIYDAGTQRVLVNNGDSDSMSVIDPERGQVVGTIPLGGGPEFLAADGKGTVWVNLFDQAAFVTVDLRAMKVTKTTPIAGCKGASSMAFDAARRRLFIGCHSKALFVLDPDSGRIIQSLPIGEHADAIVYDAARGLVFAATGDGFVTVIHQDSGDRYTLLEHVKTMRGAKTLGFDPSTGKLFSATVEGVPPNATSQPAPLGKVAYTPGPFVVLEIAQDFDLASLPGYDWQPGPGYERGKHCHNDHCDGEWGVIRIHATELTQHLIHLWEDHFLKLHPNIRFGDYFVPSGFSGLTAGTADINVMGHSAWHSDLKAFEGVHGYPPYELMFATGGYNQGKGNTPGVVFFVNQHNPLAGLTLAQLDGIFGAERTGGWQGSTWSTAAARGPEGNIRTWGQLGLTGEWAKQPIHLYGLDATLSNWSDLIQRVVFHGGDKWNPALKEMVRGGSKAPADQQIVQAVAQDKYGIGFNLMRVVQSEPGVKPLAIAPSSGAAFIAPTQDSMYKRTYPLSNAVYIYINRPPGQAIPPRVKEFLSYILSREGQQDVVEDGLYLPLNPEAARREREKLQ
jgi:phosphate transport system substrate-binding protein